MVEHEMFFSSSKINFFIRKFCLQKVLKLYRLVSLKEGLIYLVSLYLASCFKNSVNLINLVVETNLGKGRPSDLIKLCF